MRRLWSQHFNFKKLETTKAAFAYHITTDCVGVSVTMCKKKQPKQQAAPPERVAAVSFCNRGDNEQPATALPPIPEVILCHEGSGHDGYYLTTRSHPNGALTHVLCSVLARMLCSHMDGGK